MPAPSLKGEAGRGMLARHLLSNVRIPAELAHGNEEFLVTKYDEHSFRDK